MLATAVTNAPKKWETFEVELELPAGEHRFSARWENRDTNVIGQTLYINEFKVVGPRDTRTPFMKRVAAIAPEAGDEVRGGDVVQWFLTRAFRRPPTAEELARIPVTTATRREPVPLGTVAEVSRGRAKAGSLASYQGRGAVVLAVTKKSRTNTLQLIERLNGYIAAQNPRFTAEGVQLQLLDDQTVPTREAGCCGSCAGRRVPC